MCMYLYIHNKYTQHTHIYYVNKKFISDAINCLTALLYIYISKLDSFCYILLYLSMVFPRLDK